MEELIKDYQVFEDDDAAAIQEALSTFVLNIFVVTKAGDGCKQAGITIEGTEIQGGRIERIMDEDIRSSAVEIQGENVLTTYICLPADPRETLGLRHPLLVFLVKNQKQEFSFEVEVSDDKNVRRRFRASTYNRSDRVAHNNCALPLELEEGWNQLVFDIAEVTRRAYRTNHKETLRVQIHANCRLRRVYFSDRRYDDEELPADFRLPVPKPKAKQ